MEPEGCQESDYECDLCVGKIASLSLTGQDAVSKTVTCMMPSGTGWRAGRCFLTV